MSSRHSVSEWRVAFAADPTGELGLLVPVRVQPCRPPGLMATRVYVDLLDVDEDTARERLLDGVGPPPPRPTSTAFPGAAPAADAASQAPGRFPGAGPPVSNLPARNRNFAGRAELLDTLHARVRDGVVAAVEAVHGLGGVGKTALVVEFAHRFASDYDVIWWVPADQPTTAAAALAGLARRLGVVPSADQAAVIAELFDLLRGRDRWLLIYDNAEQPHTLDGLLPPGGAGNVLVTSRWSAWGHQADPLRLDVLSREESIRFLAHRTALADPADLPGLDGLGELLGDLPLALEEAAAYLEATRIGLGDYLELVRGRSRELFGLDTPAGPEADQRRVATVWSVSLDQVRILAPAAEALLGFCAFLAPDIPRSLLAAHPDVLPEQLAAAAGDPLVYNATLAVLGRYSLLTLSADTLV